MEDTKDTSCGRTSQNLLQHPHGNPPLLLIVGLAQVGQVRGRALISLVQALQICSLFAYGRESGNKCLTLDHENHLR